METLFTPIKEIKTKVQIYIPLIDLYPLQAQVFLNRELQHLLTLHKYKIKHLGISPNSAFPDTRLDTTFSPVLCQSRLFLTHLFTDVYTLIQAGAHRNTKSKKNNYLQSNKKIFSSIYFEDGEKHKTEAIKSKISLKELQKKKRKHITNQK